MDMEPRVRPGEHARGLVLIKQLQAHEEPEHGAAEVVCNDSLGGLPCGGMAIGVEAERALQPSPVWVAP